MYARNDVGATARRWWATAAPRDPPYRHRQLAKKACKAMDFRALPAEPKFSSHDLAYSAPLSGLSQPNPIMYSGVGVWFWCRTGCRPEFVVSASKPMNRLGLRRFVMLLGM